MIDFFSSDPHFGHRGIIHHCNRPYSSVEEMDEALLDMYNSTIGPNDRLWLAGDFCWGGSAEAIAYRDRIRCKNIFYIWGNHDQKWADDHRAISYMFREVFVRFDGSVGGQPMVIDHYPLREWNGFWRNVWHLYGHVHNNLPPPKGHLAHDIGVDANNKALTLADLRGIFGNRRNTHD